MKRGTRRILFWLAVLIFAAASGVAVLMAQGYTFDFLHSTFVRTGAVAVTANVDANVFVNNKPADPMSFLTHRTGVDRLLPGSYQVRVAREGYSSWHKIATVQEGYLTDFPSVMILPTDPASVADLKTEFVDTFTQSRVLAKGMKEITWDDITLRGTQLWRTDTASPSLIADAVMGFALPDNHDRVLWWSRGDLWVLWLKSTDYQPFRLANERELVVRQAAPIVRAAWFRDKDHIVLDLGGGAYRVVETDLRGGTTNSVTF